MRPAPAAKLDPIAKNEMVCNTGTSTDHSAISDYCAAPDSDLATEDAASADAAVVANLTEVVDLCAGSDARGSEFASINACVGTNLDIVAQYDFAHVWNLNERRAVWRRAISETVGPDDHMGVKDDSISQLAFRIDGNSAVKPAFSTDFHAVLESHSGIDDRVVADFALRIDHGKRSNMDIASNGGIGMYNCGGVNSGYWSIRFAGKFVEDRDHGVIGILDPDDRPG